MRAYPSELQCQRNSADADAHKQSTANAQVAQAGGKQGKRVNRGKTEKFRESTGVTCMGARQDEYRQLTP
jgi:hypothetical protein